MAEIRALGHLPRERDGDESNLARRLRTAKTEGKLSQAELAELAEIPRYEVLWEERMDTLMDEIRASHGGHRGRMRFITVCGMRRGSSVNHSLLSLRSCRDANLARCVRQHALTH